MTRVVERALLAILLLGLLGTAVELVLLKHTDGVWQLAPIVLLCAGLVVVLALLATRSPSAGRLLDVLMVVFILSGGAGVVLHYRGNVEWELERTPDASGMSLFKLALMGATPTLAPGTMLQLGLVGLLYGYVRRREF